MGSRRCVNCGRRKLYNFMNTPREILLEKHREADRRLAGIQAQVIGSSSRPAMKVQPWPALVWQKLWDELVYPLRLAWGGLAAVWLVLCAVNLQMSDSRPMAVADARHESATNVLMAWKEQEAVLAELTESPRHPVADRPRNLPPKPQSRRESIIAIG